MNKVPGVVARTFGSRNFSTSKQLNDFAQHEYITYYVPKNRFYQQHVMKKQEFYNVRGRTVPTHKMTKKGYAKTWVMSLLGLITFYNVMQLQNIVVYGPKKD